MIYDLCIAAEHEEGAQSFVSDILLHYDIYLTIIHIQRL